jgi:DNA end-binding protein Ku
MRKLAAHIVETKEAHFEPEKFQDHYENALVELLRKKKAGMPIEPMVEEPTTHRVINLMDALKASINADAKKPAAASTGTRRTTAKKKSARG